MKYEAIANTLFIENRRKFSSALKSNSMAIFVSNDIMPTNADGSMGFRQNSDLPSIKQRPLRRKEKECGLTPSLTQSQGYSRRSLVKSDCTRTRPSHRLTDSFSTWSARMSFWQWPGPTVDLIILTSFPPAYVHFIVMASALGFIVTFVFNA